MNPGDRLEVAATTLDASGAGVADCAGIEIRVPDLLPGERAVVTIDHLSRHHQRAWGSIADRIGALSSERCTPPCPAFGRCGGCPWQHLDYPAQLRHKRQRVISGLAVAGVGAQVAAVAPAPAITGYRNKGKYVVGAGPVIGAYLPRSHEVVSTLGCQVVAPSIDRVARLARDAIAAGRLTIYDERQRCGQLRYLIIRADPVGRALVGLVTTSTTPATAVDELAAALAVDPNLAGVVWLTNDATSGALLAGNHGRTLHGVATLREPLGGVGPAGAVAVDLDVTAFFQINRDQAARLYATVAERTAAGPNTRAVDLYCGVGGVSFALATTGASVVGIEQHPPAIAAASRAARAAGFDKIVFQVGDAGDLAQLAERDRPDLVVVNPPRKGLTPAVVQALLAAAPARLAYISCEPTTLGRDLAALAATYRPVEVLPFDLMPGTAKVETVVICAR